MDLLILKALWVRQVTEETFDIQEGALYPALHRPPCPRHRPNRARRRRCVQRPSAIEFLAESAKNGGITARREVHEPLPRSIYGSPQTVR
jgi:hypothetical protein